METKPPVTLPDREELIAEIWQHWLERAAGGDAGAARILPMFETWATEQIRKRPTSSDCASGSSLVRLITD